MYVKRDVWVNMNKFCKDTTPRFISMIKRYICMCNENNSYLILEQGHFYVVF